MPKIPFIQRYLLVSLVCISLFYIVYLFLKNSPKITSPPKHPQSSKLTKPNHSERLLLPASPPQFSQKSASYTQDSLLRVREREAFAFFLENHPFRKYKNLSRTELKSIPKQDRPDLAWEQDYLRTLDPKLGYVPYDRKLKALEKVDKLLRSKAALAGVNWKERGPTNVGGRTRALLFDPTDPDHKKVWAGGIQGGLWFTPNITIDTVWTKVNDLWDNISITGIVADPNDATIWYVGTGEGFTAGSVSSTRGAGLWKTTDAGASWTHLTSANGFFATDNNFYWVNDLAVRNESGTSVLYVAVSRLFHLGSFFPGQEGLFRSTDGGVNFTQVLPNAPLGFPFVPADIEIHPATNRIYLGTTRNAFSTSASGGKGRILYSDTGLAGSWTEIDFSGTNNARRVEIACAPSDPNVVYAVAQNDFPSNASQDVAWMKRTRNATDSIPTWEDIAIPEYMNQNCTMGSNHFTRGQSFYDLILAVHPTNPDVLIAGGVTLHKSSNATAANAGDVAWSPISYWTGDCLPLVHADEHQILFRPGFPNEAIVGSDGGVSYSANLGSAAGPSFSNRNNYYNVTQFYAVDAANIPAGSVFIAGAQDNGSQQFTDGLQSYTLDVTGGDGGFCHIDQDNPDIRITSYVGNVYHVSNNGGETYTTVLNLQNNGLFINPSEYDDQANILYANFSSATNITRISEIGTNNTYTNLNVNFAGSLPTISALKISPHTPNRLFLGGNNGRIFRVDDAHATPTTTELTAPPVTGTISSIAIGASDSELLVTFFNYGIVSVWETIDAGATWNDKDNNLPDIPIRWALYNPNNREEVLLATELGVYSTDNLGHGTSAVPVWGPSNAGLATVRCDMLQYRSSDGVVVLATHGRGVFTSDIFAQPRADFEARTSWFVNRPLKFTDLSLQATDWAWDFDQNVNPGTDATSQNPSFVYTSPGTYTVQLSINTGASIETKTGYVTVLPEPLLPYDQDFNSNDGGFFPYRLQLAGIASSFLVPRDWEWGAANSANFNGINSTIEGAGSWVTSLNENHGFLLRYALESPPFSLVNVVGDVFLEFDYRAVCGLEAGFQVQYSLDGGYTWHLLGESQASGNNPSETSNWYNDDNLTGLVFQPGFTGFSTNVIHSKYNITAFSGQADLRFRFVFGSRGSANDGIQIDNFKLSELSEALPIQLLSFKGERTDAQTTLLTWQTVFEIENKGFEVQKSLNGSDFTVIGFVDGFGNASELRAYSFEDSKASEAAYYRLRQVDFSDNSSLSEVIFVEGSQQEDLSMYPNPFTNQLFIPEDAPLKTDDLLHLEVWDSKGALQFQISGTISQIREVLDQKIPALLQGTYLTRLQASGRVFTQKLVKQ